ncbi:DMT family transporter [Uliginosibacterium sp. H3]|uniref:DMT family transporter n=1 Tax=Uliginosibacterium silvisoli TaxID=3114758 RepID=A0ABU6K1T9_9RHOO|nr:DMT family transporter [Uliginosibacterium sp. H3]
MSALPLSLVLLAALIHASWNLVAKKSGGDMLFTLTMSIAMAIVWAPVGLWFVWQQADQLGLLQWSLIVASGAIHLAYFGCLLRGYRFGDLSVVYPLARGSGPLLTALVATGFFGESLRLIGWLGVLTIVGGILLIAGGPELVRALRSKDQSHKAHAALRAGVFYGVVTGLFIAAYTLIDGYAVKHAGVSPIVIEYLGNLTRMPLLIVILLIQYRHERPDIGAQLRQSWKPALLIGAIAPVSYVLVLFAATMAPLSQVAPARELSMLFASLFGGRLLGERNAGMRLCGAVCIAIGVIALVSA